MLAPDQSDVRRDRARTVIDHMYAEHAKYLTLLRGLSPQPHAGTEAVADHVATLAQMS